MHVTDAARHHQPRASRPETCDHCNGLAIEGRPVPVSVLPDVTVRAYNVLIPGLGNQRFHLHPACAEELRLPEV